MSPKTKNHSKRIYVQIPAYRDQELMPTLRNLFATASFPNQLRVGIAWQHTSDEKLDLSFIEKHNIELIDIPAQKSKGCNWARNLLQERWRGEAYTLFLDSHHRFVPGWDQKAIEMLEQLKESGISKPILTAYLPIYDPANDPAGRHQIPLYIQFLKREQGLMFRLHSSELTDWQALAGPLPARFVSLHFLFAEGAFNEDICFDPSIYFFADEIAIALRAFTHGYEIFHPHKVLGWHLYERSATRTPHWKDHTDWKQRYNYSLKQLRQLYTGGLHGKWGIGNKKTITDYETYIDCQLISATQN